MQQFKLQMLFRGNVTSSLIDIKANNLKTAIDKALKGHPRSTVLALLNRPVSINDIETLGYGLKPSLLALNDMWHFVDASGLSSDNYSGIDSAKQAALNHYVSSIHQFFGVHKFAGNLRMDYIWWNTDDSSEPIPQDHADALEDYFMHQLATIFEQVISSDFSELSGEFWTSQSLEDGNQVNYQCRWGLSKKGKPKSAFH